MNPEALAHLVLGVVLIATFISLFFFTYVSNVEGQIVKSQMGLIVTDLTSESKLILTDDQRKSIGNMIGEMKVPDMSEQDNEVEENNKKLKLKTMKIFGGLIGVGLLIILFLWKNYNLNMGEITKYSLITLAMVALTEFVFVTFISKQYQMVDPNYVKYLFVNNLAKYGKTTQ